jgi:ubiquinone/menaquinone biosynthesis C-methylase UbiE
MSSLVLMRWLESAPARYDRGMRLLTLGGWERGLDRVAERAAPAPGARVLEIGCGTGALTARLLARGASVVALDQNPEMLDRARERLDDTPAERLRFVERTASEIEALGEGDFDALAAHLVFSEMAPEERAFVLRAAARVVRAGGRVVVGDEVVPRGPARRLLHALVRAPLAALTWLAVGRTSRALPDLAAEMRAAGWTVSEERRSRAGSWAVVVAERTP